MGLKRVNDGRIHPDATVLRVEAEMEYKINSCMLITMIS